MQHDQDIFGLNISAKDKPLIHSGLLSSLSSAYDPIGLVTPFILEECITKENSAWNELIPQKPKIEWYFWKDNLRKLEEIKVEQSFKPNGFSRITDASVYHFSDASEIGYGQASYLWLFNEDDQIHCN